MTPLDVSVPPIFQSLSELFDQAKVEEHVDFDIRGWREQFQRANEGADPSEAFQIVLTVLPKLDAERYVTATKYLADGSRHPPWRLPLGEEGILDFYLDHLAMDKHPEPEWTSDALRLIGNACADLDHNREQVLAKIDLTALISRLGSDAQVDLAIGVLYNLCFDYEPAQKAARAHQLFPELIDMIHHIAFNHGLLSQICDLVGITCEEFDPESCPTDAVSILYNALVTSDLGVDDQALLANGIVALLKHERFQKLALYQGDLLRVLSLMIYTYTQDPETVTALDPRLLSANSIHPKDQEPEDEEQLFALRQSLLGVLWDLSALPAFAEAYPPTSNRIGIIISWLQASEPQRQLGACYILRNLASSETAATDMIQVLQVHEAVIKLISSTSDVPVLGEALRLLKNLALPAETKQIVASGKTMDSITATWSQLFIPNLQFAAASLMRVLLKGSRANVCRFLSILPVTEGPPAETYGQLPRLFSLYESSKDSATKLEVARIIVEIWRTAHAEVPQPNSMIVKGALSRARKMRANIAEPVVAMVTANNPSLVTEAWFGLTLMASSKDGSEAVLEALYRGGTPHIIKAVLARQETESPDWHNARILVNKLLRSNAGSHDRMAILESLSTPFPSLKEH